VAAPAAAGEPHQVVLDGLEAQVLGHPLQQGHGATTQRLMHGVQEAAAGGQVVALHKTLGTAAQTPRLKVVGTCDAYCWRGCDDQIDQRFPFVSNRKVYRTAEQSTIYPTLVGQ